MQEAGLLVARANSGIYVAEVLGSAFSPALTRLFGSHEEAVFDYIDFRRDMEGLAAERAARLGSDTDLAVVDSVFQRMEAERERIAVHYRSEGKELSEKKKAEADRLRAELINTAQRKAEEIMGMADAEATKIYAEAYGRDPEFFEFYQTLETYKKIMTEEDILVIPADSPLLELLKTVK